MSLTVIQSTPPTPIVPMMWLDWRKEGDGYVGADYRIQLIEPHRWEVLLRGRHLFFDGRLSSAVTRADHHFRDRLRVRDLITWGAVLVASVLGAGAIEVWQSTLRLWSLPLFALVFYAAVSAVVRGYAAMTRNRFDPYRRRAPWEPRGWWQR
jgi:hypothetical protein